MCLHRLLMRLGISKSPIPRTILPFVRPWGRSTFTTFRPAVTKKGHLIPGISKRPWKITRESSKVSLPVSIGSKMPNVFADGAAEQTDALDKTVKDRGLARVND